MIILLDMDGTICNWNLWFNNHREQLFPDLADRLPDAEKARSFDLYAGLGVEEASAVTHIFNHQGFYADIPILPGAVKAYKEMLEEGHTVAFVTSPWYPNPTCMQDKAEWIRKHFGENALLDLVITKDKTMVRGDILIDDKPVITGKLTPTWTHILFDQEYNKNINKPRITKWTNWREVVYATNKTRKRTLEYK